MSVELYRESPGKFDSRILNRKTLNRWTGRNNKLIDSKSDDSYSINSNHIHSIDSNNSYYINSNNSYSINSNNSY